MNKQIVQVTLEIDEAATSFRAQEHALAALAYWLEQEETNRELDEPWICGAWVERWLPVIPDN